MTRVNIRELIHFYDSDSSARKHASAIKSVAGEELNLAILVRYFDELGAGPTLLHGPCTTGKRKGPRLDAWLRVTRPEEVYYQVEVKAWSFHGAGGGPSLHVDCRADEATCYRREAWLRYWDNDRQRFRDDKINKVLTRMQRRFEGVTTAALACLWAPMHPEGKAEPLFQLPVCNAEFDRVAVFSVSTFLRNRLGQSEYIDLALEDTKRRLLYLSRLFEVTESS